MLEVLRRSTGVRSPPVCRCRFVVLVSAFGVGGLVAKGTALLVSIPTSAVGTSRNRGGDAVDIRAGLIVGTAAAAASV